MVPAVPCDAAIEGVDLLKVDVEGLEAQLLGSSRLQLRAFRPVIMVEIHDFNRELRALLPDLLDDLDATAYAMHRDHLVSGVASHLGKRTAELWHVGLSARPSAPR